MQFQEITQRELDQQSKVRACRGQRRAVTSQTRRQFFLNRYMKEFDGKFEEVLETSQVFRKVWA